MDSALLSPISINNKTNSTCGSNATASTINSTSSTPTGCITIKKSKLEKLSKNILM
jgi:hypothetical protein